MHLHLTCLCLSIVSYDRILSIERLSDVPNPWKGFSMNRCLVLAVVILLVSSGVHEVHGERSPSFSVALSKARKPVKCSHQVKEFVLTYCRKIYCSFASIVAHLIIFCTTADLGSNLSQVFRGFFFIRFCFPDALDYFVEETGIRSFYGSLQAGSLPQVWSVFSRQFILI